MAQDKKEYGKNYQNHYLEQYKLYLGGAEKISDRRESANKYFVTINSALFVVAGLVIQNTSSNRDLLLVGLALLGMVISVIFWFLLNSYKQLNTAKFQLIHAIEEKLPIELYKTEWELLGEGKDRKKYFPFSHIERLIPLVFGLSYFAILIFVAVIE